MNNPVSEEAVLEALRAVRDPDLHRDIVTLKFVKNLRISGGQVAFTIELTTPACPVKDQMRDQARAVVAALPGVTSVDIEMTAQVRSTSTAETGKTPVDGREEHHRGRRRQGRRRQDDRRREPRHCAQPVGRRASR